MENPRGFSKNLRAASVAVRRAVSVHAHAVENSGVRPTKVHHLTGHYPAAGDQQAPSNLHSNRRSTSSCPDARALRGSSARKVAVMPSDFILRPDRLTFRQPAKIRDAPASDVLPLLGVNPRRR